MVDLRLSIILKCGGAIVCQQINMEPCDLGLYLENNVFPKKFKYKILKKRKIDSQNFECELRIALNDFDDVKEWLKHFKGNTNTEWLLRQNTTCEEDVLNQLYVCQNSSYGKKRKYDDDEDSKSDFNCKAAISVKIKKGGKRTYYQDEYVKKGYKGIMRICFIHTHLIDKAETLNMARHSEETKKAFMGYFTEGMTPSEAIKNHEEILLLEGHEDLGDSRKNPPEHWVYSLYEEWTKQIENRLYMESQLTRKYTDVELGKTIRIGNTPKVNPGSGKAVHVVNNSKEHQNVSGNLPKCGNVTKVNSVHFIKNSNENNLKTTTNIKPVFVRIKKGAVNKEASSLVKSHEVQKEAETVLQQILTRFQNSDDKEDIMPNSKNKQTFQRNKVVYHRSDAPGESMNPVLKKCVQNFEHSSLSENLFGTGNVSKDVQNRITKDDRNGLKQLSKNISNNIIQQTPVQKAVTNTKDGVLSQFGNPSSDERRDKNGLKNIDQRKGQKSNHFVDSEMLFQDCEQKPKSLDKLINTDRITPRSVNDSFDNCEVSSLVSKNYCDIDQACSSSSFESLNQIFNQSGSVQSIKNPISSAIQGLGLSRPMFDGIDPIHKLPKHDTEVTSSSALCHENLFHEINQESTFRDSKNLEGFPVQGCPFPLPEDFYSTLAVENNSPYLGNQNGVNSQMFTLPLSKDLYNSNESSSAQILGNQNQTDDQRYSLRLPATFCNSSDPPNVTEDSENHSISSDISYSLHNPDFSNSCDDMNSSRLSTEIDMSNEDSLQQIFPDLNKLQDELNNFSFVFPTAPNPQQVDLCCNNTPVSNQLSLINTYTNSLPELQANPFSLFENYEDNILPLPENLKGNIEDIDILKNILNIKCNKLEEFFQQPENCNQKEILEKWDSEMCRLRSLLEQNVHDRKLMREANQFLERIKESVVTPSELAILFSSACNLKSKQKKY
ncbi:hypothetical protein AVEN_146592-1 [Araneus ventricosus]|uniref:Uncharacterized protein n=1 Tax=Araneus ventricosus TaxID=182803 RepID=A0A4Y2MU77_ARAVE|nr:hypothetical protein AVEN_146592-1 [Araneus ventricosus]